MLRDRLSDLVIRLRALFRRRVVETELDEELRFHFEREVEKNVGRGMSRGEARRQARLAFGGLDQVKEECREARGVGLVETVMQDLRYAVRQLAKSPGFTAVAVLSLALGIGANTAIFSLVDAVLLRMLPVERPEELERVQRVDENYSLAHFSYAVFREFERETEVLSGVIARKTSVVSIHAGGRPERRAIELVSGNYFSVLGVRPLLGRVLRKEDDRAATQPPVAVLSFRYWRERMSGDPQAVGQTIRVNNRPVTVVGVARPGFFGIEVGTAPDAWIPVMQAGLFTGIGDAQQLFESPRRSWLNIVVRRAPGVSRSQAQAALHVSYQRSLEQLSVRQGSRLSRLAIDLEPGGQGVPRLQGKFDNPLFVLVVLVALVLAIACANVASLLVARYAARRREMAVRLALGAGRFRLVRQLLTESVLLGILGGGLGVLLANWGVRLLLAFLPSSYTPVSVQASIDDRVLVFAVSVSLLTTFLFGLVPAMYATRSDISRAFVADGSIICPGRFDLRRSIVALQVALSLLLIVSGGLFLRSLLHTAALDIGMDTRNVLVASIDPRLNGYTKAQTTVFFRNLEARLRAIPGVRAVGFTGWTLLEGSFYQNGLQRSAPQEPGEQLIPMEVAGDFFAATGTQIIRGRAFGTQDSAGSRKVTIINETAARYHFPDEDPIGKAPPRLKDAGEIVGIARDSRFSDVHEVPKSFVYLNAEQREGRSSAQTIYLRTAADAASYAQVLRREVAALDDRLPLYHVKTFAAQKDEAMARERLVATLSGFFAGLSLLLAAIGIYGVVAYGVVARTREIGVRMSLGAQRGDVVRMVLRSALGLVAVGLAVGLPLSLWLSRYIENLLFGVEPNDPLTLAVTVTILTAVALLAASIPARRASRVDPLTALRHE